MTWRLLPYQTYNAFYNMAIDEAVFRETIKNKQPPTLRFFGWRPSAVSIGYFQELKNEINVERCRSTGVDIVRRITGGKAVYHQAEITYALTAGKSDGLFPDDLVRTYEIISVCLARGLSELGIHAHLAKTGALHKRPDSSPCCFAEPSGNELLVAGRKICGSAQMRTHGGFLQHGSLLMSFDPVETAALIRSPATTQPAGKLSNCVTAVNEVIASPVSPEALCKFLQKGFSDELGIGFSEGRLTPAENAMSDRLVKKYKSDAWNRDRKKEPFPSV
jgi:Lipoate-protein ligase A